jgi:hypothetical protein
MIELFKEIFQFAAANKKMFLVPLVLVLLLLGAVVIFAQGSAIAPLIYTIF